MYFPVTRMTFKAWHIYLECTMSMDVRWGFLPTACSNWIHTIQTDYKLHNNECVINEIYKFLPLIWCLLNFASSLVYQICKYIVCSEIYINNQNWHMSKNTISISCELTVYSGKCIGSMYAKYFWNGNTIEHCTKNLHLVCPGHQIANWCFICFIHF